MYEAILEALAADTRPIREKVEDYIAAHPEGRWPEQPNFACDTEAALWLNRGEGPEAAAEIEAAPEPAIEPVEDEDGG